MRVPYLLSLSPVFGPFSCFSELLKKVAVNVPVHLCVHRSVCLWDRFFIQNFHKKSNRWNEFHCELCVLISAILPNAENHFNKRLGENSSRVLFLFPCFSPYVPPPKKFFLMIFLPGAAFGLARSWTSQWGQKGAFSSKLHNLAKFSCYGSHVFARSSELCKSCLSISNWLQRTHGSMAASLFLDFFLSSLKFWAPGGHLFWDPKVRSLGNSLAQCCRSCFFFIPSCI